MYMLLCHVIHVACNLQLVAETGAAGGVGVGDRTRLGWPQRMRRPSIRRTWKGDGSTKELDEPDISADLRSRSLVALADAFVVHV